MDALALHVAEALQYADSLNHSARSRANLVAAQALHLSGRPDLAKAWYRRSKDHSIAEGDDATISALMHNMAWLRMLLMRQLVLTGQGDVEVGRHALMNAESNFYFDEMIGDSSWHELKPILRAQIFSLQGDPVQALLLYEEHLVDAKAASRLQANLLADKAWCHVQLSQSSEALGSAEAALENLLDETQIDDRAATHSRLAEVFAAVGKNDEARNQEALALRSWTQHRLMQAKAIALLGRIDENGRGIE